MTEPELHLIWTAAGKTIRGKDVATSWKDEIFSHGPLFAGSVSDWKKIFVSTSAAQDHTEYVIDNLRFFIEADTRTTGVVRQMAERNQGVQISFDGGLTFQSLTDTPVVMPPGCIASNPGSTRLGPYDTALFQFRISIPPDFSLSDRFFFRIAAEFEVL